MTDANKRRIALWIAAIIIAFSVGWNFASIQGLHTSVEALKAVGIDREARISALRVDLEALRRQMNTQELSNISARDELSEKIRISQNATQALLGRVTDILGGLSKGIEERAPPTRKSK